jgi:hypothetical protein
MALMPLQSQTYPPAGAAAMSSSDTVRVFCGSDRSQWLAFKVLAHSINRHTQRHVEIRPIDNGIAPTPADPRNVPYTNFSFARFAIPALCEHAGKAIYMDSDMLVFRDIGELWDTPMAEARIAIEIGSRLEANRSKQAAVMLLDCSKLDWQVERIVADLGIRYDYNALIGIDCLLEPGQMQELIVSGWNDLDHYDPERTRNLHFTEIRTQPWVYAAHPNGQLWVDEVLQMLASGALGKNEVEEEVRLGYVRPSLLPQLGLSDDAQAGIIRAALPGLKPELLLAYDRAAGFVAHRELLARFAERKHAIARFRCQQACARHPLLAPWHRLVFRLRYGD